MAQFKDRLPDLAESWREMDWDYQQRCEDVWADLLWEFQMRNGLTDLQMEKVEMETNKARRR